MFQKILVANRGEIANRIIRACHELRIKAVAAYAQEDDPTMPPKCGEVVLTLEPFISTIRKQHEEIPKSADMRVEFTANVSHELKTPIALIQGYAE